MRRTVVTAPLTLPGLAGMVLLSPAAVGESPTCQGRTATIVGNTYEVTGTEGPGTTSSTPPPTRPGAPG